MPRLLFILFICFSFFSQAQKFEYQFAFEGIGDNREFDPQFAQPQTIFGTRGAFEVGLKKENHRMRVGMSHLIEFGNNFDALKPQLTLYYEYKNNNTSFLFGSFPRRKHTSLPLAMLQRLVLYYQPNIEGIMVEKKGDWGFQNIFIDWLTRQTNVQREEFMVATNGKLGYNHLFVENTFMIIHSMRPKIRIPNDYINDYIGVSLLLGVETSRNHDFYGYFKTGLLSSSHRDHGITDKFHFKTSSFTEIYGKFKYYALKSILHKGGEHALMLGDPLYKNKDYSRTDIIWHLISRKKVKAIFTYSLHIINWEHLNHQQMFSLKYVIDK